MPLDFTQIDPEGNIIERIAIGVNAHAKIFFEMETEKFKLLERIRDYYDDAIYSIDELEALREELIELKKNHLNCIDYCTLLDSMRELVEASKVKNLRIEVIAD